MKKKTHKQFISEVYRKFGSSVKVLTEYSGIKNKVKCVCSFGHLYEVTPSDLLSARSGNTRCRECFTKNRYQHLALTHTRYLDRLKTLGSTVFPLQQYEYSTTKILHKCNSCKHEWHTKPNYILNNRSGCPKCATRNRAEKLKLTDAQFKKRLSSKWPNIKILRHYEGYHKPIEYKCTECKTKWFNTPANCFATGCTTCSRKTSRIGKVHNIDGRKVCLRGYEKQALDWILNNTENTIFDIVVDSDKEMPVLEYSEYGRHKNRKYTPDFFIPKKNLLVEVKSTASLGLIPSRYCKDNIKLFRRNQTKANVCVNYYSYKYKMLLMTQTGKRIRLPDDWYNMGYTSVLAFVESQVAE